MKAVDYLLHPASDANSTKDDRAAITVHHLAVFDLKNV